MFTAHSFNVDDQQFMNALYEKYHRIMYAIVMRYTSDPHDCEDILQDAIENLCGKVTKLRELTERGQYLYITATVKNTAINLRKHQRVVERYIQPLDDEGFTQRESFEENPEYQLEQKEYWRALQSAWNSLSEEDRELLYKKYFLDKSNEEIASWLHCQKNSVRMRLTRVRRKIIELMEAEQEHDKT